MEILQHFKVMQEHVIKDYNLLRNHMKILYDNM